MNAVSEDPIGWQHEIYVFLVAVTVTIDVRAAVAGVIAVAFSMGVDRVLDVRGRSDTRG